MAIWVTPAKARALRRASPKPEIRDRIDGEHGRGIVALLLISLRTWAASSSPASGGSTGFTSASGSARRACRPWAAVIPPVAASKDCL